MGIQGKVPTIDANRRSNEGSPASSTLGMSPSAKRSHGYTKGPSNVLTVPDEPEEEKMYTREEVAAILEAAAARRPEDRGHYYAVSDDAISDGATFCVDSELS